MLKHEGLTLRRNRYREKTQIKTSAYLKHFENDGFTFHHYSPLHTQLSNHFSLSCFPSALNSSYLLLCSAALPWQSQLCLCGIRSPRQKHYGYWALRSASRLDRLCWHRPLFVLALRIKKAFLVSAPSRLSSLWFGKRQSLNNRGYPVAMRCVNVSDSATKIFTVFLSGPADHKHNHRPSEGFSFRFCSTWKWKHKTYFILTALIRLTVIESFRKHNVILGESAQNWKTEYRCE